jgi:hypothetical protein
MKLTADDLCKIRKVYRMTYEEMGSLCKVTVF